MIGLGQSDFCPRILEAAGDIGWVSDIPHILEKQSNEDGFPSDGQGFGARSSPQCHLWL